jgi:hypothetical protein
VGAVVGVLGNLLGGLGFPHIGDGLFDVSGARPFVVLVGGPEITEHDVVNDPVVGVVEFGRNRGAKHLSDRRAERYDDTDCHCQIDPGLVDRHEKPPL